MKPAAGAEKILVLFVTGNPRTGKSTPPWGGGVSSDPYVLKQNHRFSYVLKPYGWAMAILYLLSKILASLVTG